MNKRKLPYTGLPGATPIPAYGDAMEPVQRARSQDAPFSERVVTEPKISEDPVALNITRSAQDLPAFGSDLNRITTETPSLNITRSAQDLPAFGSDLNRITTETPSLNITRSASTSTPTARPSLFGNTAPGTGTNYANTLNAAVTGTIWDPMAAGTKEAQARSAANARASTAGQIAKAGFAGTGIGASIAGGVDNQLTKQKFDTMIGIEQARNEGRVNALGEARAYGVAENEVQRDERNYNRDVVVSDRNYDRDVLTSDRAYDRDVLTSDRKYAADERDHKDKQTYDAYQEALLNGSDADVIAAYAAAFPGRTLDPAAVAQYRGYARTAKEQGIRKTEQDLNSETGRSFAAAVTSDPNVTPENFMGNKTITASLQKLWESIGETGTFDQTWAKQQVQAVKDSSDLMIMAGKAIDYQVSQKIFTEEEGATAKAMLTNKAVLAAYKKQPDGTYKWDKAALEEAMGWDAGSLGGGTGGTVRRADVPKKPDGSAYIEGEGYKDTASGKIMVIKPDGSAGEAKYDPDTATNAQTWGVDASAILKNSPTSDTGKAIADARARALDKGTEPWSTLGKVGPGDPVYDRLIQTMSKANTMPTASGQRWATSHKVDTIENIKRPDGSYMLMRVVGTEGGNVLNVWYESLDGTVKDELRLDTRSSPPGFVSWVSGGNGSLNG